MIDIIDFTTAGREIPGADWCGLKERYLASLADLSGVVDDLREIIAELGQRGVGRQTLVRWGVEAGYSEGYMRTIISKLCCESGARIRKAGAGPVPPKEALAILESVCQEYGAERAVKLLRAAFRVARTRAEAAKAKGHEKSRASSPRPKEQQSTGGGSVGREGRQETNSISGSQIS